MLRIVQRVITLVPRKQAGLKRGAADTGAVTLIQRFGSAANLKSTYIAWRSTGLIGVPRADPPGGVRFSYHSDAGLTAHGRQPHDAGKARNPPKLPLIPAA